MNYLNHFMKNGRLMTKEEIREMDLIRIRKETSFGEMRDFELYLDDLPRNSIIGNTCNLLLGEDNAILIGAIFEDSLKKDSSLFTYNMPDFSEFFTEDFIPNEDLKRVIQFDKIRSHSIDMHIGLKEGILAAYINRGRRKSVYELSDTEIEKYITHANKRLKTRTADIDLFPTRILQYNISKLNKIYLSNIQDLIFLTERFKEMRD